MTKLFKAKIRMIVETELVIENVYEESDLYSVALDAFKRNQQEILLQAVTNEGCAQ